MTEPLRGGGRSAAPHVERLSRAPSRPFADGYHELVKPDHFWFEWRLASTLRFFEDHAVPLDRPLKALEIGMGTGLLRAQLEGATPWTVDGADVDLEVLSASPPGRGRTLFYDVRSKRPELAEAYDLLILFDVIEHVEEPAELLSAALHHLKPSGLLAVDVPALPWLFGSYDRVVGHFRRYLRRSLRAELDPLGVEVLATRYWGLSLVPLLALRNLACAFERHPEAKVKRGFKAPSGPLHRALKTMMASELALIRRPPCGASLLLLARRA